MSRQVRSVLKSIVGLKFGRWLVLEHDIENSLNRKTLYICKCDCGIIRSVRSDMLKSGRSVSCGCHKKQRMSDAWKTHGLTDHPLMKKWISIKQRCYNLNNSRYKNYGGRGIEVCDEWKDNFKAFYDWCLANNYSSNLTIDRINNNGNYEPNNCRFISNKKQQLNKSTNHYVTIGEISLTIKEWCDRYHINRNTFVWRLRNGWNGKDLLRKV